MKTALLQFQENIKYARELGDIARVIGAITTPVICVDDIFRAQIVFAVSALDQFIHEIIRIGMIEIQMGKLGITPAYEKFEIPMINTRLALSGAPHIDWLESIIRKKHSWVSFQDPDKITNGIRLISQKKLWEEVGKELSLNAKDIKKNLRIIVDRRNKIAHEADIDPSNPGFRWGINTFLAEETILFTEKIVNAIYKTITSP